VFLVISAAAAAVVYRDATMMMLTDNGNDACVLSAFAELKIAL